MVRQRYFCLAKNNIVAGTAVFLCRHGAGAASGCLIALVLLDLVDTPSLIGIAAIAAMAAVFFAAAQRVGHARSGAWWSRATPSQAATVTAVLALLCIANASTLRGLQPLFVKGAVEDVTQYEFVKWNTYSRIAAFFPRVGYPYMWGPSPLAPEDLRIEQRYINIDGEAATSMPRFSGGLDTLQFLNYDITTLAYSLRNHGRAAIIGVGGGRDMLSAYYFGFRDITGVELNPILVDLLTNPKRFRSFSGLADLPNVRFFVDDVRSWFARTTQRFDLIQMSLVDTWAATGAGGFTLSENGLYTVEGWEHFLHALTPRGIFTVSRWYAPGYEYELGRLLSLAIAALQTEFGVTGARAHIFLAGQGRIGTLVVSAAPLTPAEIATLRTTAERYRHKILLSPDQPPASEVPRGLWESRSIEELDSRASTYLLDVSPATDARPFFFNMLRLDPFRIAKALAFALHSNAGVVSGNLHATGALVLIIVLGRASDGDDRFAASALGSDCRAAAGDLGNGLFSADRGRLHVRRNRSRSAHLRVPWAPGLCLEHWPVQHHPRDGARQLRIRADCSRHNTTAYSMGGYSRRLYSPVALVVPDSHCSL